MDFSAGYSETYYLLRNKDVRVALENGQFSNGFEHFRNFGHKENRGASEYFDVEHYLNGNPDVAQAVSEGRFSAFEHFINFGAAEGRIPFQGFSSSAYLNNNPDVGFAINAGGGIKNAWEHYTQFGWLEGRQGLGKIPVTFGMQGNDVLSGNGSHGFVFGDAGNDVINVGGEYLSFLKFQPSGNKIYGNQGADVFNFTQYQFGTPDGFLKTTVMDYSRVEGDKIRINSATVNNYNDILSVAGQNAQGDVTLNISGGIVLEDVTLAQLNAQMFEFV